MTDLRTREGREAEVLNEVRDHGGFSMFWATENAPRAHAIERLVERGVIVREEGETFPWCRYRVVEPKP